MAGDAMHFVRSLRADFQNRVLLHISECQGEKKSSRVLDFEVFEAIREEKAAENRFSF